MDKDQTAPPPSSDQLRDQLALTNPLTDPNRFDELFIAYLDALDTCE